VSKFIYKSDVSLKIGEKCFWIDQYEEGDKKAALKAACVV